MKDILNKLILLYGLNANKVLEQINVFIKTKAQSIITERKWVSEADIILITYGDSIISDNESGLYTLKQFLDKYTKGTINSIHLLPMYPYSSDDGFSIIDYRKINPLLGSWEDIAELEKNYDLMFDAVINHISISSQWFQGFLNEEKKYADFFIECYENIDYSTVIRPRALPLYYKYKTNTSEKNIWATFSKDQVDLNFHNPKVLLEILDILVMYANKGARFIRLDAIGFIWKKIGTSCMHLKETHALIQIIHSVLEECVKGTILVSETNVPHQENISYFGNGYNEAQMVYQFPLPPLLLFSILSSDASKLSKWAKSLEKTLMTPKTTYFNFLASHDGIGMRPVEGILSKAEQELVFDNVLKNGGRISYKYNDDGSKTPYELNINYQDALYSQGDSDEERIKKFLVSQSILLSIIGVPGIYIHSLLGSRNDYISLEKSGINRRINREKLNYTKLINELKDNENRKIIFNEYLRMIDIRKNQTAFSPNALQTVIEYDKRVFSFIRKNQTTKDMVLVLANVSNQLVKVATGYTGINLFSGELLTNEIIIKKFEYIWLKIL